jgi:protein-disulfide isomerase
MAEALKCDVCETYYDSLPDQFIYDKDGFFIKVIIKNFIFEDQSENNFL